jgi:hypothetical protein
MHPAQPTDAPSSRRSSRSHFYTPGFPRGFGGVVHSSGETRSYFYIRGSLKGFFTKKCKQNQNENEKLKAPLERESIACLGLSSKKWGIFIEDFTYIIFILQQIKWTYNKNHVQKVELFFISQLSKSLPCVIKFHFWPGNLSFIYSISPQISPSRIKTLTKHYKGR